MKTYVHLDSRNETSYSVWKDGPDIFSKLIPPSKVISILEVCGDIRLASLSSHYDYLAVVSGFKEEKEILYVVHLKKKKIEVLNCVTHATSVLYFVPDNENSLLVGSLCGRIFHFNIKDETVQELEGHRSPPNKICLSPRSDILITCSSTEVLVWSWPLCVLTRRLKIDSSHVIIEGGHIVEKGYLFVCFESGVILLWSEGEAMKEYAVEPPEGVSMEFKSFTVSSDGDWIVGVGSEALIVIYSVASHKVVQVVHFSHPESLLGVNHVQFLPPIHPQYPKTFLIVTSSCVIIVDFTTTTLVKVLKSHRHSINGVCVSGDGFVLGVTYGNGTTKLYTLLSFYPPPSTALNSLDDQTPKEVEFKIIKTSRQERKQKIASLFDETKWTAILEEFGEYPEKYRKHIWLSLLRLPRNFSILNEILIKDKKHKFESLGDKFPDLDKSVLEILTSTLECLSYWSPFMAGVDFIPGFVAPFVELFAPNLLLCFEASLCIILNWCSVWFETWPSPPTSWLKAVDTMVCHNDAELWLHLQRIQFSATEYAWPLLTTAFNQVFTKEDWLILWDNIISSPPSLAPCLCAAFTLCLRTTLLKCSTVCHAQQLYSQETWIPVRTILSKAKHLHASLTWEDKDLTRKMTAKRFLPKGALAPFDIGPPHDNTHLSQMFLPPKVTPSISCSFSASKGVKVKSESVRRDAASLHTNDLLQKSPKEGQGARKSTRELSEEMEQLCLQNIQRTRRRQLARHTRNLSMDLSHGERGKEVST